MKKNIFILFSLFILSFSSLFALEEISIGDFENRFNLSQDEINGLLLIREEEKLARDVYMKLYEVWDLNVFYNIAKSEESHTKAVKNLLDKYGIEDPMKIDEFGVFENQHLQELYNSLIEKGTISLLDALLVGATIEDLDIYDLQELKKITNIEDIIIVYDNLEKGSRNHIRSFIKLIEKNGGTYQAEYISEEKLNLILNTQMEKGIFNEDWVDNSSELNTIKNKNIFQNIISWFKNLF